MVSVNSYSHFHIGWPDWYTWYPVCEWLTCLAMFHTCWLCLFSALQPVSDCCAILCFRPVDVLVLCSPESEWLLCLTVFQTCWWWLCSALQLVSCCHTMLCFKPVHDTCALLSSWWVAAMPRLAMFWACWWCLSVLCSSGSEWVPHLLCFKPADSTCPLLSRRWVGYCASLYFNLADVACPLLYRKWVAAMSWCILSLLKMPVLCSSGSE